jgi:hypothetical protein
MRPRVTSLRQKVRLWFEFYQLARTDENLYQHIAASEDYYRHWFPVEGVKFDDWWREKGYLFGERVRRIKTIPNTSGELFVAIPLEDTVTRSLEDVKKLVLEAQKRRGGRQSPYRFTGDAGFRGGKLYATLLIYRHWFGNGSPAVNPAYLEQLYRFFKTRKRARWLPQGIQSPDDINSAGKPVFSENQVRQVRRDIKNGAHVCKEVAQGRFPGNHINSDSKTRT